MNTARHGALLVALLVAPIVAPLVGPRLPAQDPGGATPRRPNIVLILADDMGYSDLGCYGGEIATPNLDALAGAGLRFTQFYNTSKCFPSRACLLTGAYAQQVGMARRPGAIRGAVTLGHVLRAAGYRTWWSGKHHGTQNPLDLGFDRYYGLRDGGCNYFNPGRQRPGEPKPAQKRADRAWCFDRETLRPYTPDDPEFYTTDAFTDRALAYLDEYGEDPRPFFLYLAYNAPHDPLQAWPEDIARYRGRYDAGWEAIRAARYARQRAMRLFGDAAPLSPASHRAWQDLDADARRTEARRMEVYAAMVECMDRNIGRVIAKLRALGRLDDTLVLFASDNGGSAEVVRKGSGPIGSMTRWASLKGDWANVCNTPFRRFKNHSHEGGICTPLVVHWPARIRASRGGIVRTPGHFIDVMATLVEVAGGRYPARRGDAPVVPLQGTSLAPLFDGRPVTRRAPLFWQWGGGRAVRDGDWKLVRHGRGAWELYDLARDRTETRDLAAAHPARVAALAAAYAAWWERVRVR